MNEFTNNSIDVSQLPKFEEVKLKGLQKVYFKVIAFNILLTILTIFIGINIAYYFMIEAFTSMTWVVICLIPIALITLSIWIAKLSFNKKGYAFREHDAIYKSGLISETTTIIPFNRVQHVALHQGFISRKLGLASVELFTAGGNSSDLDIPGLLLSDAQIIKNLVSQKINPPKKAETIEVQPNESFLTTENE